jgi:hypothetical protein
MVKVKTIVGIDLGLQPAQSIGLIPGDLTATNILFDSDRGVQIVNLGLIDLEGHDGRGKWGIGGFSEKGWTPHVDTRTFFSLFLEIGVGHRVNLLDDVNNEGIVDPKVEKPVLDIIGAIESDCGPRYSIHFILFILEKNDFQFLAGVGSVEVSVFVHWVQQFQE